MVLFTVFRTTSSRTRQRMPDWPVPIKCDSTWFLSAVVNTLLVNKQHTFIRTTKTSKPNCLFHFWSKVDHIRSYVISLNFITEVIILSGLSSRVCESQMNVSQNTYSRESTYLHYDDATQKNLSLQSKLNVVFWQTFLTITKIPVSQCQFFWILCSVFNFWTFSILQPNRIFPLKVNWM